MGEEEGRSMYIKSMFRPSRDELRRMMMMIVHRQQGGRNFAMIEDRSDHNEDVVDSDNPNRTKTRTTSNIHESSFKESSPKNDDVTKVQFLYRDSLKVVRGRNRPVSYPVKAVGEETKRNAKSCVGLVAPGRRIDDGDCKIRSNVAAASVEIGMSESCEDKPRNQPRMNASQSLETMNIIQAENIDIEFHVKGGGREESLEQDTKAVPDSFINREITIIQELGNSSETNTSKRKSSIKQLNGNPKGKFVKKEIVLIPDIGRMQKTAKKNSCVSQLIQREYHPNEFSIVPSELQKSCASYRTSTNTTTTTNSGVRCQQQQQHQPINQHQCNHHKHPTYVFGNRVSVRSLISMNSCSSSQKSTIDEDASAIVHRVESRGIESLVSRGSTAYELECLATSSLATAMTACSLSDINRSMKKVQNVNTNRSKDDRPYNPMAVSLLKHQTSKDSRASSRISIVSAASKSVLTASTYGSQPPLMMMPDSLLSNDTRCNITKIRNDDHYCVTSKMYHNHPHPSPTYDPKSQKYDYDLEYTFNQGRSCHDAMLEVKSQRRGDWCTTLSEISPSAVNDVTAGVWTPIPNSFTVYQRDRSLDDNRCEF